MRDLAFLNIEHLSIMWQMQMRACAKCQGIYLPPPTLRKHQPGQESDGQTESWCLDKAVQPRDARYQKKACPKNLPIPHPKHNSRNRALEHNVQANFSKFWRSSLPIRGIRSLGIVHVKGEEFARCPSGAQSCSISIFIFLLTSCLSHA
jgi:hypothetical protein